jgi:hypothetical protein
MDDDDDDDGLASDWCRAVRKKGERQRMSSRAANVHWSRPTIMVTMAAEDKEGLMLFPKVSGREDGEDEKYNDHHPCIVCLPAKKDKPASSYQNVKIVWCGRVGDEWSPGDGGHRFMAPTLFDTAGSLGVERVERLVPVVASAGLGEAA